MSSTMRSSFRAFLRPFSRPLTRPSKPLSTPKKQSRKYSQKQEPAQPADSPDFISLLDRKPKIIMRHRRKHRPLGLAILALIPLTAFGMGTWQIKRLKWKTDLIAYLEDMLVREPLPLPPRLDPEVIPEFDFRRVTVKGRFLYDKEMLLGPRMHDGINGYEVITPFERADGAGCVLVNRGWIAKEKMKPESRDRAGYPEETIVIEGLLRKPYKKNMFTPNNMPKKNAWYFPDVREMARHVGAQEVYIEEIFEPDLVVDMDRTQRGIPIGKPADVKLKNDHMQYIVTWYSLAAVTSLMFYLLIKKPPKNARIMMTRSKDTEMRG